MTRTETPLFRKALALKALWCLLWAVIGYLNHRAVPPCDRRAGDLQAEADDQRRISRATLAWALLPSALLLLLAAFAEELRRALRRPGPR